MAIARVFFDVSPNLVIPGLVALATEKKFRIGEESFGMFMNRKRTRVKIIFSEQTMFVYSSTKEITVEELKALPALVQGKWYDEKSLKSIHKWLNQPITSPGSLVKVA